MPGHGIRSALSPVDLAAMDYQGRSSFIRELHHREERVRRFCDAVEAHLHLQLAVRSITTVDELTALSKRHRVPIDHLDVALFYRFFNQPFWPWFGQPMQMRRHFAHLGRLPDVA